MMGKHAPWRYGLETHPTPAGIPIGYAVFEGNRYVCSVTDERRAALIAAAPETAAERDRLKAINAELLEALKLVVSDDDFCHKTTLKPMPKEMRDFLDAAIARAESGT